MDEQVKRSVVADYIVKKGKHYIDVAVNYYSLGYKEIARDYFNMAYSLFSVAENFGASQTCKDYLAEVCERYCVDKDRFLYDIMAKFVAETRMAYMK